ncbi:MAG: acetoacetyl-CoA reductase [Alcaligenaceae bacterium]|nr:acetoacetyl-CoA reductase [Alcaligenaceae bacterium]
MTAVNKSVKRTALVTGGTGGLGSAIARALHDAGHTILVTMRPGKDYSDWLNKQREEGYDYKAYVVDVGDYDSCVAAAAQMKADGHHIDILINNAGITRDASFRKMDKEKWDQVLSTNLDSMFNMTKPLIEDMLATGWGRIVNISSVNGSKGAFGQANYSSAKSGIYGFTKSLALEFARKGITVNAVSPGYLNTEMVAAVPKEVMDAQILPQIPVGRLGEPSELAALIAFMCSEQAGFMTGANIAMNGGQHMY